MKSNGHAICGFGSLLEGCHLKVRHAGPLSCPLPPMRLTPRVPRHQNNSQNLVAYSMYFSRFIDEMEAAGLSVWGMTMCVRGGTVRGHIICADAAWCVWWLVSVSTNPKSTF